MKILHTVQRYYPDSGGSEEVVRQISERLVQWGHEVTVLTGKSTQRTFTTLNGVNIVDFNISGNEIVGIHGEKAKLEDYLKTNSFDIIMNYAAQIWSTDLFFDKLSTLSGKKVLVPCGYSELKNPLYKNYFTSLPDTLRKYDAIVYLSPNYIDTKFGESHSLTNGIVIPNAADENEFSRVTHGKFKERYSLTNKQVIINVSNHSTLKGHRFFWNCIKSLNNSNAVGVLIGNPYFTGAKKWLKECYLECRLHALQKDGLLFENLARPQVIEAYTDADIFLFGSKVECSPLVMFESFASKTLFVTTNCGNVADYNDIVRIVENEREAIDLINDYFAHKERYEESLQRGYNLFLTSLNWSSVARQYEQLYFSLLKK